MFDKGLIDSDLFIDLPIPSQCLYFHLSMRADDEGFIGNVKGILRLVGFKDEDLRPLVERKFIIVFENGVIVIKHWKLNNYLRTDRCKETTYKEEKKLLIENNGKYEFGIPNDNQRCTQYRIEENSIDKNRIEEKSIYGEFEKVKLTKTEFEKLKDRLGNTLTLKYINDLDNYIASKGKKYNSHYATILNWYRRDNKDKNLPEWFGKEIERAEITEEEKREMEAMLSEFQR